MERTRALTAMIMKCREPARRICLLECRMKPVMNHRKIISMVWMAQRTFVRTRNSCRLLKPEAPMQTRQRQEKSLEWVIQKKVRLDQLIQMQKKRWEPEPGQR